MIIEEIPNDRPSVFCGDVTKIENEVLQLPVPEATVDFKFCECPFNLEVYADAGGEDYKNDFNGFLFRKIVNTDTFTFTLLKDGNPVPLNPDISTGAYGLYNDFGTLPNPLYVQFEIEWLSVFTAFGHGSYKIQIDSNVVGVSETTFSNTFILRQFSDVIVNKSVRITTLQNGNIESNEFDYTGINFRDQLRLKGIFGDESPIIERDTILSSDRSILQIQDKIQTEYTLKTKLVNSFITDKLIRNFLLANQITVNDYYLFNHRIYRNLAVSVQGDIEVTHFGRNKNVLYQIKFTDEKDNTLKRNV